MWRTHSLEKTLMLGKTEGRKRRGQQRMRWLDGITDSMDMSLGTPGAGDGQGGLACWGSWGHKESDMTEWLNWTEYLSDAKSFKMGPYTSLPASISSITFSSPFQKLTEFCCDCTSLYSHQQCTRWRGFKKLKIELPYDPAVPLLGIYCPKSSLIKKYICTPMFTAALFTTAKIWKQPQCVSTDEWVKKM